MAGTTNAVIAELTRYASLIAGIVRDSRKPGAEVRRKVFIATMKQMESDLDDLRRTTDLGDAGHAIMETASALNHAQAKPESMATFLRYAQVSIATAIKQYRRQHPAGQSLKSTAIKTSQRVVLPDGTQGVVTGVALGDNGEPLVRVRAVKADGALLNWFREVSVNGRARGLQFSASEPDSMIRAAERAGWIERRPNYPSGVTNPQYDITPKGRNALKQQPARSAAKSAPVTVLAASEVRFAPRRQAGKAAKGWTENATVEDAAQQMDTLWRGWMQSFRVFTRDPEKGARRAALHWVEVLTRNFTYDRVPAAQRVFKLLNAAADQSTEAAAVPYIGRALVELRNIARELKAGRGFKSVKASTTRVGSVVVKNELGIIPHPDTSGDWFFNIDGVENRIYGRYAEALRKAVAIAKRDLLTEITVTGVRRDYGQ